MSALFNVEVEESLLNRVSGAWPPYVVVTTPTPWKLVEEQLVKTPLAVGIVESLELEELESLLTSLPVADLVVGIGGAGCQEAAKYYAREHSVERIHVPTVVSNNAALSTVNTVFSNDERFCVFNMDPPKAVLFDAETIRRGRGYVNRAGLGEHLCIHTGLYDWRLASEKGLGLHWNHDLAREIAHLEMRVLTVAPQLRELSLSVIEELVRIWARVGELIHENGCMNFSGASEHVFALNLARVTRKRLIHGQAVGLGVVVMSLIQQNGPEVMAEAMSVAGARFKPQDIDCSWDDVGETLRTLPEQAKRMRGDAPFSIADQVEYSNELINRVREFVDPYPTPTDDDWPLLSTAGAVGRT